MALKEGQGKRRGRMERGRHEGKERERSKKRRKETDKERVNGGRRGD